MTRFSSQLGTKSAPGELEPFGWTRKDRHFHDARATQAHQQALELGVHFGRRQIAPQKQHLLKRGEGSPAKRAQFIAQPQVQRFEIRHPRVQFISSR